MNTPGKDATFDQVVRGALLAHTCPLSFWDIVSRRDAEGMLPAVVAPKLFAFLLGPAGRWAALLALAVALWGHGWLKGANHAEAKAEALRAKQEAAALAHAMSLSKRAEEMSTAWYLKSREINDRSRTVEVTKYVTRKADAACPVPVGLVRLWDDSMQAHIYQPASSVDDTARDVALSDVARGIVEAKRRFELNRAQCEALQEWARGLK